MAFLQRVLCTPAVARIGANPMKVWITADALTTGIEAHEGEAIGFADLIGVDGCRYTAGEWYPTPEAAVARARTMRDVRVAELRREIGRLGALVFGVGA